VDEGWSMQQLVQGPIFHIGQTPFHDVKYRHAAPQQNLPSS
jgi:hypothetical protein